MNIILRLSFVCTVAFCLVGLTAPSPAKADGPYVEAFDFVIDHEPVANCGDFTIIADGGGRNRITTFLDREGNPIRIAFQGRYRGTLTNSVTGASLVDAPSVANITIDLIEGTQTNVGAFFTVTIPGRGAVFFEAGRLVFAGDGPPVFLAGQHHPPDESIAILCDALR